MGPGAPRSSISTRSSSDGRFSRSCLDTSLVVGGFFRINAVAVGHQMNVASGGQRLTQALPRVLL